MADYLDIAGRVRTTAADGVAIEAQEIKDLQKNKNQQQINADVDNELDNRYTKQETYNRDQLNELITTPDVNRVYVIATNLTTSVTDLLPSEGSSDTLYNVGNWDGTQYDTTVYSIYGWDGTAYVCLAVRSSIGEVYDISANHPDGQGNPTPYADLAAALGTSGANIPADIRRGGMSIKFIQGTVQSSDNNYVQFRLMAQSYTTDVTKWQGVTGEINAGSKDIVDSEALFPISSEIGFKSPIVFSQGYVEGFEGDPNGTPNGICSQIFYNKLGKPYEIINNNSVYQIVVLYSNDGINRASLSGWSSGSIIVDTTYPFFRIEARKGDGTQNISVSEGANFLIEGSKNIIKRINGIEGVVYGYKEFLFNQGFVANFNDVANGNPDGICSNIYETTGDVTNITINSSYLLIVLYSNDGLTTITNTGWKNSVRISSDYKYFRIEIKKPNSGNIIPSEAENLTVESNGGINNLTKKVDEELNGVDTSDLDFKQGFIVNFNDTPNGNTTGICCKILRTTEYNTYFSIDDNALLIAMYSNDGITVAGNSGWHKSVKIDNTYKYYRIQVKKLNGGDITPSYSQNLVVVSGISGMVKPINGIIDTLGIAWRRYAAMIPITVKKDGTGDFTTIQEAINSITDASVVKQYDVQVYDDFEIDSLTDLWQVNNPSSHSATNPSSHVALVITKDYVHIRGIGSKKRLYVESPSNLPASSFQYIQVIYPMGNCIISNFSVEIKGGRYAIHQESGGSMSSLDYHATTVYDNLDVIHYGNSNIDYDNGYSLQDINNRTTSPWTAVCAQANGATSGTRFIYNNVRWLSPLKTPFYTHENSNFDEGNVYEFYNCKTSFIDDGVHLNVSLFDYDFSLRDYGSGKKAIVKAVGCTMPKVICGVQAAGPEQAMGGSKVFGNGGAELIGEANAPIVHNVIPYSVLILLAANGMDIKVNGGTALDDVFGKEYKHFNPDTNTGGATLGNQFIVDGSIYSLANRLGDCSVTNKTLIVTVGNQDYTIIFDKNYANDVEVQTDINAVAPNIFMAVLGNNAIYARNSQFVKLETFPDCKEIGYNNNASALLPMQCVVRDYANGYNTWKLAGVNDEVEGIVGERIDVGRSGNILLKGKNIFGGQYIYNVDFVAGQKYDVDSNGYLVQKADGRFICISDYYVK